MTTIYLEPNQVPRHLAAGYSGKMFRAEITESMTIPADAGLWDGGSRNTYHAIRLADGASVPAADHSAAPWDDRRDNRITIRPGFAIVQRCMSQGKDLGLTFYLHPADAAPMLPKPEQELSRCESIVLKYTAERKSSYGGRDRYQMYRDDARYESDSGGKYTREQWEGAKAALIEAGYLNKAGAITTKGRNAHAQKRGY